MNLITEAIKEIERQDRVNDIDLSGVVEILHEADKAYNKALTIPAVVVSEERAELCDNPNCEDGIVDRDYYGHPIYCQVCESHN